MLQRPSFSDSAACSSGGSVFLLSNDSAACNKISSIVFSATTSARRASAVSASASAFLQLQRQFQLPQHSSIRSSDVATAIYSASVTALRAAAALYSASSSALSTSSYSVACNSTSRSSISFSDNITQKQHQPIHHRQQHAYSPFSVIVLVRFSSFYSAPALRRRQQHDGDIGCHDGSSTTAILTWATQQQQRSFTCVSVTDMRLRRRQRAATQRHQPAAASATA